MSNVKRLTSVLPVLILAFGAILRITGTGAAAIWQDEANTVRRASSPFLTLWMDGSENSGDLLLEIILRPLMAISHSVWMLRLPSMLAGLLSLWLVRKLMQRLDFTLPQQIAAATIVACLPGLLWIAQDARAYSLLACLFLAALWFALESRWYGLLAVCGLMIYAHKIGPAFAITALVIGAYVFPWKIRRILLVAGLTVIAWIPALVNMLTHWIIQQPWQPQLTGAWLLYSTVRAIWPMLYPDWFWLLAFAILLRTLLYLFYKTRAYSRIVPLIAWTLPCLALVTVSLVTRNNMLMYRTLQPALFPFALWLGWEIGRERSFTFLRFPYAWTAVLIIGLALWHPAQRGGGLDQVASQIRSQWRNGDTLLYTTDTIGLPFDYYLGDLPHAWDATVRSPFLLMPSYQRLTVEPYTGAPARSWVIIPEDGLITQEERAVLTDLVHHQQPVYTVAYMQAATINVYLVEEP